MHVQRRKTREEGEKDECKAEEGQNEWGGCRMRRKEARSRSTKGEEGGVRRSTEREKGDTRHVTQKGRSRNVEQEELQQKEAEGKEDRGA